MAIVYDHIFTVGPSQQTVGSDFPGPPSVFEQTGIPFETFGTGTLRMRIDVDLTEDGQGFGVFDAYVFDPGHGTDQTFISSPVLLNNFFVTLGFVNVVLTDPGSGGTNTYIDFTGPGTPQSLYLYTPRTPPTFDYSEGIYRNLHVTIESSDPGPTPPAPVGPNPFSLQSATPRDLNTVRATLTSAPKAIDPTESNDALNIANWSIVGPALNSVNNVTLVVGDPKSLDLHLARALVPGLWTATASNFVSSTFSSLVAPVYQSFELNATNFPDIITRFPTLNDGAKNSSNCDDLRKFLNPAIKGPNIDAVLAGICYGDSVRLQIANSAFDQLFIPSASGVYLDRRVSNIGIKRPTGVGMSDTDFRDLAVVIDNQKLTREAILETLEVYYGKETVKASATSIDEPFTLVDGDTLNITFNYNENVTILFQASAFKNIATASALEVETFINNKLIDLGSTARASTSFNTTTGKNRVKLYSGKRGLASSVKIVGGRAQEALAFPLALFTNLGGSPYQTWNITLDTVDVGNVIFTNINSTKYDFNNLLDGDLVYIYGNEFTASNNIGTFAISNVKVYYSGSNLIQSFEIVNPFGTASSGLAQTNFADLQFFRPINNTLYTQLRRVIVTKQANTLDIIIPATTQIVSRTPQSAAYGKIGDVLSLSSLIRNNNIVTAISATAHGMDAGDSFIVDGAFPSQTPPTIIAGTPSVAFSSNLATGITDSSLRTTVSASNTINKIRHKAISIPNNILMVIGGIIQQDTAGTPIVANTTPCVLDITSKTVTAGALQENYRWKQLVHTLTIGNYAFGATALADGRVMVTGGFSGDNQISAPFTPVNNYDVLYYNPTISADTQTSGTLPTTVGNHSQCSLNNGNVIISGGWQTQLSWNIPTNLSYKFTASSNLWSSIANLNKARMDHETAALLNGNAITMGGRVPFRRISNTEDPDTIGYYALDAAPANVTPDLIHGNNITISGGVDAVSGKGKAGLSFLPGSPTNAHTTAGATQTNLNTSLLGEWAAECWVLAGAAGTFMSNGTAGGGSANNCLLSFGVAKYTSPNANDGKFYWRWESGSHVENIQFSSALANTLIPTYESADQGVWHHFALTKSIAISGTAGLYDVSLYVDGTLVQAWFDQTNSTGGATGLFYLAKDPTLATMTQLNTRIDEVRLINAARTKYDVLNHYNEQCGFTLFDSMDYWANNYKIGKCLNSCEVYDPTGNTWTLTGDMNYAKIAFGIVLLPDGRLITIGGLGYDVTQGSTAMPLNITEIYDPASGKWIVGPTMPHSREFPTCVLLNNQIWVMGGRAVTGVDILDLTSMTWKTSITPESVAPYRSVGGLVDSQTIAMCGGAISTSATHIYSSVHSADLTSRLGFVIIPATEQVMGGRLNGLFSVSNVVDSVTFQYNTPDRGYGSSIASGVTATKMAANASPAGLQGPYSYDPKRGLPITSVVTTLGQDLEDGQGYSVIAVASTANIPNSPGYLAFNFGYSNQVGPIKYLGTISTTKILLDPSYRFAKTQLTGSSVTLLAGRSPFQPPVDKRPGSFYVTSAASGRVAAQNTLDDIVAAGIDVDVTVIYPSDLGLGSQGRPTHGNYKLSDVVSDYAGDDVDGELKKARGI